ncbi:MAG: cysteine--tRNA ligase [Bdellovibrionales bacterium]|nr:cysteine--tRNA ligase [Bdellovibrionales bacterium]
MTLRFYNTLTRSVEDFTPLHEGEVRLYSCGPTVYNFVHIGNLRCYIFNDLLRRYLKYKGYRLIHVMNITDVDDKTIRDSRAEGTPLREFTDRYLAAFLDDLQTLNIEVPEQMPRATDEIDGMVEMVQELLAKGNAYQTDSGDIYFAIDSFGDYGKLVNLDPQKLRENAAGRLSHADEYDKESANDFALWKAWDEDDGEVFWETPLGKGRPGWHLECSVMSTKYLGQPFDIHTGGIDLAFPHHTNEIAQSECACGKEFVRYWLHNEHLIVDGKKMSKSLGNFYTLRDLLAKGFHPLAIRYELLKTHYRQRTDFREDHMAENVKFLERIELLQESLRGASSPHDWPELPGVLQKAEKDFESSLDNDLNISGALASLHELITTLNREAENLSAQDGLRAQKTLSRLDSVFGFFHYTSDHGDAESDIQQLIDERQAARANKDFARADAIRDELLERGIELKDTPDGVKWKRT